MSSDPFDTARSALLRLDDLLGRLVLVFPTGEHEDESKMNPGKMYKVIESNTVVLDGDITAQVTEIPYFADGLWWSGSFVVRQLSVNLTSGKPSLGRLVQVKSRNYPAPMWQLDGDNLTDGDRKRGLRGFELYEQRKASSAFVPAGRVQEEEPPF